MEQKKLLEISDKLLDLLLDFKKDNLDFTFSLRERDSPQAKGVKRLEKGQWFQGSDYIYVPLFRKGDNARKIKTIGFVVGSNKEGEQTNYIEVSFKKGDFTNEEISFHKELSEIFDIKLNNENVGYFQFDDPKNYIENLGFYLNEFRTTALELLKSYKLEDRFLITEDNFQKRLKKIYEIKKVLGDPSYSVNNRNTIIKESDENIMKQPLNQILYGPPGTGKTYNTINKALEIINDEEVKALDWNSRTSVKALYDKKVNEGQIVFTTFHQSMTYEDFIEGIKPETINNEVIYDIKDGIFKLISDKAKDNWISNQNEKVNVSFEDAFENLKNIWEEDNDLQFSMKREGKEFTILGFSNKSISFKKSSGGTGHTLSINTLRELFYGDREITNEGVGIYYPPVLEYLNNFSNQKKKKSNLLNFVLIIDEINRGNVSQIFGELITLIEEDKRLGNKEVIKVTLPYSKNEKFGVPSNLYIIGTMNTADRSVEALDTALRRRFVFEEMPPKYKLEGLQQYLYGFKAGDILEIINQRIEKLLDRDHQIGHAYFLNKDENTIVNSFYKNIIPLLQEYFFGDYGKIGLVLGSGFVDVDNQNQENQSKSIFASFEYENDTSGYEERKSYKILGFNDKDFDFGNAINLLMNQ